MEGKTAREIQALLAIPFAPEDIEWRLQVTVKDKMVGIAIPYVTNRAIQSRLDEVVGPENWHNEFRPWHSTGKKEAQICGISIYFENRGWITKWDGAEDSDIEPIKGGLSDSMKRAAVQWGVGRILYSMDDTIWVSIEPRGQSYAIKDSERPKLNKAYLDMLKRLGLSHAEPIGAQAQLVPKNDPMSEHSSGGQTSQWEKTTGALPVGQQAHPQEQQSKPPAAPEPQYDYTVTGLKVQNGMRGKSTSLELTDLEGKRIPLFARGEPAGLVFGTRLSNVKFTVRQQNTVVFNVLESYEIAGKPTERAA